MAKALPRGVRENNGSYEARAVVNGIRINLYGTDLNELMEEFEKAKAFVLCFPEYYCEEYEDIENEYSECESCHSKEKTNSLFYAQPKGYIKKHENDYGFAGLDGTGELLLLPKLVEKLKESGVDKKYFQPIISKSKKILGYTFITDNILPQKSYIDENYKEEIMSEILQSENEFFLLDYAIDHKKSFVLDIVKKKYADNIYNYNYLNLVFEIGTKKAKKEVLKKFKEDFGIDCILV